MDKIAIISDIHGNLEALNAVLNDIKEREIEKIYCLGDIIAKGTHSNECIKLIRDNCEVVLKGNCDDFFSTDIDLSKKTDMEVKRILWNKEKLSNEEREYLKGLPYCHEFYLSGRLVRMFHATPTKIDSIVGNIDDIESMYSLFLPSENTVSEEQADIVVYGHIHTQCVHHIYNRTIINTGSVGNSLDLFRNDEKDGNIKNTTVANYLILSGTLASKNMDDKVSYELVGVPYDIDKELCTNEDNIELESYREELKNGKYRNMERFYKFLEVKNIDINKI